MNTQHILIPDNLAQIGLDRLGEQAQFRLTVGPCTREETLAAAANAQAMIVRSATTVDAEMLDAAPSLRVIVRAGVGTDNIDLKTAGERGIVVMNAPDSNTIAAAEHTFALILALARNIPIAHQAMREGRWDRKKFMGVELRGKTLGIIGLGRIGRAVARRAKAFRMTLLAHDPVTTPEVFERTEARAVSLEVLFAQSDFITLHAPVTDKTRGMINASAIARMKKGVRIINAARGALIDARALADAVQRGKVAGVALDVYDVEPPPADYPLLGLEGVVHTPHLGASTFEAQLAVAEQAAEQVVDALLNHKFRNVVNTAFLRDPLQAS